MQCDQKHHGKAQPPPNLCPEFLTTPEGKAWFEQKKAEESEVKLA